MFSNQSGHIHLIRLNITPMTTSDLTKSTSAPVQQAERIQLVDVWAASADEEINAVIAIFSVADKA